MVVSLLGLEDQVPGDLEKFSNIKCKAWHFRNLFFEKLPKKLQEFLKVK